MPSGPAVADGIRAGSIVALEPPWSPTTRRSGSAGRRRGPAAEARPGRSRAPRRPAPSDGYVDGDGFRGSAADPVHMYLKEIGKVKLLDAALEVELAERIVAGNEARRAHWRRSRARPASATPSGPSDRSGASDAGRRPRRR